MDVPQNTNSALLSAISLGDKNAEKQLVDMFFRGLVFILQRHCNNPSLAQDLAQETFIVVLKKARDGAINKPEALSAFIRQTGINLLIAYKRKETRQNTHSDSDTIQTTVSTANDAGQNLHFEKLNTVVNEVIEELSQQRDKDILRSVFIQQESKNVVCAQLSLTSEHFDRVLYRARERLKQKLVVRLGIKNDMKSYLFSAFLLLFFSNLGSQNIISLETTREIPTTQHFYQYVLEITMAQELSKEVLND